MFANRNVHPFSLFLAVLYGTLSLVIATSSTAQDAPPEREPTPTRERAGGQPREQGENQEGTPDGQPEAQIAPRGNARIAPPEILPNRWYLGIYGYNTEHGVMVTDVVPGSPAAAVGLESRDLIVSVSGFQVGYVGDNLYALGDELQNRATRRGQVRLLVQNRRNNELVNIDVPLERHGAYYRRER